MNDYERFYFTAIVGGLVVVALVGIVRLIAGLF